MSKKITTLEIENKHYLFILTKQIKIDLTI